MNIVNPQNMNSLTESDNIDEDEVFSHWLDECALWKSKEERLITALDNNAVPCHIEFGIKLALLLYIQHLFPGIIDRQYDYNFGKKLLSIRKVFVSGKYGRQCPRHLDVHKHWYTVSVDCDDNNPDWKVLCFRPDCLYKKTVLKK